MLLLFVDLFSFVVPVLAVLVVLGVFVVHVVVVEVVSVVVVAATFVHEFSNDAHVVYVAFYQ